MVHIDNFTYRLGNQLFQIAAAVALADANNDTVSYPEWKYANYFCGDFTTVSGTYDNRHISDFHYTSIPYKPNMGINGYFQSEKFFQNSIKKIKRMFDIKMSEDFCEIHGFDKSKKQIGIHIRRGDYVGLQEFHPLQSVEYYTTAIDIIKSKIGDNVQIVVFSDDLDWCKTQFSEDYLYPDVNDIETLFMMTHCHHYVIANSSFSWWGAYLCKNKNSIVVAPKIWFGPTYAHFNTKDIYCKNWIVL